MGYSNLESEASLETLPPNQKPCSEWPNKGCIEMDDVCFRYSEDLPLVLKSLSLYISSGEKVGQPLTELFLGLLSFIITYNFDIMFIVTNTAHSLCCIHNDIYPIV